MIIDLPLTIENEAKKPPSGARRPIRMGFFHFSNNNLSIRRQCARDLGMYDLHATKSEDVDLCFRIALSPRWVAWREDGADVQHKGRATLGALLRQMWGWGFHLGYPYAKIGMRGLHVYWLSARRRTLGGALEWPSFPILVCVFGSEFYAANALAAVLLFAAVTRHPIVALAALSALVWAASGCMYDVIHAGLGQSETIKLAAVHYLVNLAFSFATLLGGLRHRVLLLPSPVLRPALRGRLVPGGDKQERTSNASRP